MINSSLLDCASREQIEENFDRVLGVVSTNKMAASEELAESLASAVAFATPVNAVAAKITLTLAENPTANDTMTIGTKVYTFKASVVADGDIAIGADVAATRLNVVAAINGTGAGQVCTAHPDVTCAAFASADAVVTAKVKGVIGNALASTSTYTAAGNVFSATALAGGVNGTTAAKGAIRVDATKIYVATAANTIVDANWKSATLT